MDENIKVAHWITKENGKDVCSNCRIESRPNIYVNNRRIDFYCPYCGCKMIEMSGDYIKE